ncbi:MAG: hypothetical protein WCT39_01110 [Candidatus Margulisiibacteriota bacterium]
MSEFNVKLVQIINLSPLFKGSAVLIIGLLALLFAWWMNKRWKEPLQGGFLVFIGVAVFVVLFGLFILVFQPQWWKLPY